jgi:hypothetical protein
MIDIEERIEQKRQNKMSAFPLLAFNQFHFGADTLYRNMRHFPPLALVRHTRAGAAQRLPRPQAERVAFPS